MAFIFLTPDPGVYRAPVLVLPPGWLWGYAPEPHDDVYYVHETTGSTQWAWPGPDEAGCERFWYWLSEALKVADDGQATGVNGLSAGGDDGPRDRSLHGFGRPQARPSTSGMTFKQKMSNFFTGDFSYRPPPGSQAAANSKPNWRPWKTQVGFKPPSGFNTYYETQQSNPTPGPSMSSYQTFHNDTWVPTYPSHPPQSAQVQVPVPSPPSHQPQQQPYQPYQSQQQGAGLSPRPSVSSTNESHQSHQSSTPSFATGSSAPSNYPTTPASSQGHGFQQWQAPQPPPQSQQNPYANSNSTYPQTSPQQANPVPQPPQYMPPYSQPVNTNPWRPLIVPGKYNGQAPGMINAGAFKPRPRELGDDSPGEAAGYFQQPPSPGYGQAPPQPQWGSSGW